VKITFKVLIVLVVMFFQSGCDNTLDVNADWKEVAVVYGLLNPTDQINYIRINKAYINPDGDALTLAKISDSLYFDSLDVKVVEYRNGIETRVYQLDVINGNSIGLPKDSGLFANDVNYLYKLDAQIRESDLQTTYNYKVIIVNRFSGKIVTSFADMIGRAELLSPIKFTTQKLNIPTEPGRSVLIKYREGRFAKMYDASIRLYYDEIDVLDTNNKKSTYTEWTVFTNKETLTLRGYEENYAVLPSVLFYDNLLNKIPVNANVKRRPTSFGIYLIGGGEQIYTYIQVNKPSIGIVQKKPEYTNIEPGLGIFSAKYINRYENIKIDESTLEYLVISEKMKALNFTY
jgi:hypothetical protein